VEVFLNRRLAELETVSTVADQALVKLAQEGAEGAYIELYARHSRMAKMMVSRIVRNEEDTEDVLQESGLKAFLHLRGFDGRAKFSTWFARICVNSALTLIRTRKNHLSQSLDNLSGMNADDWKYFADKADNPEQSALKSEVVQRIRRAVHALPPTLREVIELRHFSELSIAEVARRSGLSVPGTKSRLLRARKKMSCT